MVLSPMNLTSVSSDMPETMSSALSHAEMREDTAVRRAVKDMTLAGINPILGFTGTGSASSSASSANVSADAQIKAQKIAGIVSIVSSALGLAGAAVGNYRGVSSAYQNTGIGFHR